tara:strand:- start:95 stop:3934 length:3840 start_codon:yes stop_codon:yes gene_type:complete
MNEDELIYDEDDQKLFEELDKEVQEIVPSNATSLNATSNDEIVLSDEDQALFNKLGGYNEQEIAARVQEDKTITDNKIVALEDRPLNEQTALSQKDIENSEQFVSDILIYREGRYGTSKKAGADFFQGAGGKGVLEANNVNLVDDWLDNYRFVTGNEINALNERDWLQNLKTKSETYKKQGDTDNYNKTQGYLAAASRLYQDTERLAPIFGWDNTVGGIFSKKRFEGMSAGDSALEIMDAVGGHIAAGFSSPSSVFSIGASKFLFSGIRKKIVSGVLVKPTAMQTTKSVLGSAAVGAGIDGAAAGYLDTIVQGAEIEAGVRKTYDRSRTLTAMGVGAVIGGGTSAIGTGLTARMKPVLTKAEMQRSVKKIEADRVVKAKETIKFSKAEGKVITDAYKAELIEAYGKDAFKLDLKGNIVSIDRAAIIKRGKELIKKQGKTTKVVEPAINHSMFQRTMAGVIEVFQLGKNIKTLRPIIKQEGTFQEIKDREKRVLKLFVPLKVDKKGKAKNNEKITDRIFKIMNSPDINVDIPYQILAKYGVTPKEWSAMLYAQGSRAGTELRSFGLAADALAFANRTQTAQEIAEEQAELGLGNAVDELIESATLGKVKTGAGKKFSKKTQDTDAGSTMSSLWQRLNNIRRGGLVSGVVTAIRNGLAQVPRMGIDTLIHTIETVPIIGNPEKKFSVTSSFSQMKHTFYDPEQAVHISNLLLEMHPKQNSRMWNQYMEVKGTSRKKNPHTETLSGIDPNSLSAPRAFLEKGITKGLDGWERVVHIFNVFNRWQESLYRRGALMASIEGQLIDQGKDLGSVMQRGRFNEEVTEDMMAKAVDYALEFTYGADPKLKIFRELNNMITNSPFTLGIPFPRFMFKAIEMSFNYNVTGIASGLYRTSFLTAGRMGDLKNNPAGYRQLAEGIVGTSVLLPLGYLLRDPDGAAGSEWYKLRDGSGNEFDARVYGPIIVPYLLLGELIRRQERGVFNFTTKEITEAVTGTNFRSVGSIHNVLTDVQGMTNLDEMSKWAAGAGRVLGDAAVGFMQPILQTADWKSQSQLKRDYKEDPTYASGVEAFLAELWVPINRRIQPTLNTVDDYFGTDLENKKFDYAVDPRITDVPQTLVPILKVMFGATMNKVPPEYVMKLGQLGFTYKDFMAKSPFPSINRAANRQTSERVAEEMPSFLKAMYELTKEEKIEKPDAVVAGFVDRYLKHIRKESLAEAMIKDEGSNVMSYIRRYRSLPARSRIAVVQRFEAIIRNNPKDYPKGAIDYLDVNHLATMLELGRNLDVR